MPESGSLSCTLAGEPSSVSLARAQTRRFTGDTPRTEDVELIVSELATNAVRHSASRHNGGEYELRLEARPGRLRIEVVDQGEPTRSAPAGRGEEVVGPTYQLELDDVPAGKWGQEGEPDEAVAYHRESGRGLEIVDALADKWGHDQEQDRAVWWAEVGWEET